MRIDAKPQAAMAQFGSSFAISWKVASPCDHQNECSMATPRVTFCCTFGLQELGNLTVPSFCAAEAASSSCAAALAAKKSAATKAGVGFIFTIAPLEALQVQPSAITAPRLRQIFLHLLGFG